MSETERLREALDEIRSLTGRDPLLVGFAHGAPSRQELAERLDHIRAVSEAALSSTPPVAERGEWQTSAARDVLAERKRQVEVEGWTPEHDDGHHTGDMAKAAAAYAYEATRSDYQRVVDEGSAPVIWPWDEAWWRPKDPRRDLVRAGALILAEIERLDRAAPPSPRTPEGQ